MFVVSGEAFAEQAGLDPDDSVIPGVVLGGTVEDFEAEPVFLETVGAALEGLLDDVAQQGGKLLGLTQVAC